MTLPLWMTWLALDARARRHWRERLGLVCPTVSPGAIWIHGASVGELRSVAALLPHLPHPVLITTETDTGLGQAMRLADHRRVVAGILPADHRVTLAPLWAEARPRAVIFVEGAYWPVLAALARSAGTPVIRVSARVSPQTRARVTPTLYRRFSRATTLVCAADEAAGAFFTAHTDAPVIVAGDLKGDAPLPPSPLQWARPFVAAASTRQDDESMVLRGIPSGHQLLIAPRKTARARQILDRCGGRAVLRSELSDGRVPAGVEVVVLDTLGELAGCLEGARAAYVGGTFDAKLGGHSAAEAARWGVPVVAGPQIWANKTSFVHARILTDRSQLGPALAAAAAGPRPPQWSSGAVGRTLHAIGPWLTGAPAPERAPRPWARPLVPLVRWMDRSVGMPRVVPGVWVVALGSDNARGGGKTSAARWMARTLAARGDRVGVIVRGVGAATGLGDEGQLFLSDGHMVAAGPWGAAADTLIARGATALVLDDGLRQDEVACDVRIAVVDARYPSARGPFPMGEARARRFPVDGVLTQHGVGEGPTTRRELGPWHPEPPSGEVAAFCGIARAADFFETIELPIARTRVFPDHLPYTEADLDALLAWADGAPLVCTAKDWVRLPEAVRDRVFWRDVVLEVEDPPPHWFRQGSESWPAPVTDARDVGERGR